MGMRNTVAVHNRLRNGVRTFRRWVIPYVQSVIHPDQFRPILSYLFTEWKCNVGCHYCYTYDNSLPGMTYETATEALDWLRTTGCRVVAIMGGEPLLRKDFVTRVVRYGVDRGFFMYLPTNGLLMDRAYIDEIGATGVAAINLAVDTMEEKPGMPKSFSRIEPQFHYLLQQQDRYGYLVFLNINITSRNVDDVKALTCLALKHRIGVDYHINERPHVDQPHYRHSDNDTYFTEENLSAADEILDWLIDRNLRGQPMINSLAHLRMMKLFVRGEHPPWACHAGLNSCAVRMDGSLSPCFGLYSASRDWGTVGAPSFDRAELARLKQGCTRHCLSTCQVLLGQHYTESMTYLIKDWLKKHSTLGGRCETPLA